VLNQNLKLQNLALNKFTAFNEAEFTFSPGINVLIGANSTGKSHVMKILYSLLKLCERADLAGIRAQSELEKGLKDKLSGVFKPNTVGHLVRRGKGNRKAEVSLLYAGTKIALTITNRSKVTLDYEQLPKPSSSLYLPAHEMLSFYEGFIAAYTKRETSFDETYYDLSLALNASPLRDAEWSQIKGLIAPLQKAISGKKRGKSIVKERNGRFYIRLPEGELEAQLVAEGYRKIAALIYLISNGSLTSDGILFWDEPVTNLNPLLIMPVIEVLQGLALSGMQIFLATHDYLLSQELSLLAEYPSNKNVPIKFFSLYHPSDRKAGVLVEEGKSLPLIEHNPILAEFAAHHDREVELFDT
jgi:energy-coupling factor transporter ATP-binding protein EcfA2